MRERSSLGKPSDHFGHGEARSRPLSKYLSQVKHGRDELEVCDVNPERERERERERPPILTSIGCRLDECADRDTPELNMRAYTQTHTAGLLHTAVRFGVRPGHRLPQG